MDKELLRIAIIATGLIIMVAMVVSAYLKSKEAEDDEYEEYEEDFDEDEYDDEVDEPVQKTPVAQALKKSVTQKQKTMQHLEKEESNHEEHHDYDPPQRPSVAPSIIQFSVITKGHDDFNVADVFHSLEGLGLEYGSMKIFERIDKNRFVHFGVASMVEPGTFPNEDLESFYCPGVVFFMQIDGLDDPQTVFDDYIATAVLFAQEMDGVVLDHRRQPLTNEMVDAIRLAL